MTSLKNYPTMDVKAAVISAVTLCVWGAFIIGIQTYVLVNYTQVYHDQLETDSADQTWGDAYNGLALANAGACLLFGAFAAVSIPDRTPSLLILNMILAVLGACAAAGSTVLAAIETDWLNVNVNTDSTHPCSRKDTAGRPSSLECTNWVWLEVTVAVLSGLAFCSYTAIAIVVSLGLSSSQPPTVETRNKSLYDDTASNKTSFTSPYQAYQSNDNVSTEPQLYSDQHPQYSKHLQQLSVQQLAMEQDHRQSMMKPAPVAPVAVTRPAPEVPSQPTVQRGRLQVMYSQRGPAPPPPVPPKTYNNNNKNNNYYM